MSFSSHALAYSSAVARGAVAQPKVPALCPDAPTSVSSLGIQFVNGEYYINDYGNLGPIAIRESLSCWDRFKETLGLRKWVQVDTSLGTRFLDLTTIEKTKQRVLPQSSGIRESVAQAITTQNVFYALQEIAEASRPKASPELVQISPVERPAPRGTHIKIIEKDGKKFIKGLEDLGPVLVRDPRMKWSIPELFLKAIGYRNWQLVQTDNGFQYIDIAPFVEKEKRAQESLSLVSQFTNIPYSPKRSWTQDLQTSQINAQQGHIDSIRAEHARIKNKDRHAKLDEDSLHVHIQTKIGLVHANTRVILEGLRGLDHRVKCVKSLDECASISTEITYGELGELGLVPDVDFTERMKPVRQIIRYVEQISEDPTSVKTRSLSEKNTHRTRAVSKGDYSDLEAIGFKVIVSEPAEDDLTVDATQIDDLDSPSSPSESETSSTESTPMSSRSASPVTPKSDSDIDAPVKPLSSHELVVDAPRPEELVSFDASPVLMTDAPSDDSQGWN